VIRVYDDAGNVIETHEHKGDFKGEAGRNKKPPRAENVAADSSKPITERPPHWQHGGFDGSIII
jgi:hypothetical protein